MAKERLIFKASNLGPITEAKIELKPLTVFVGHSCTGKSYMATMIYSVLRHLKSCVRKLEHNKHTANVVTMPGKRYKSNRIFAEMREIMLEENYNEKERKFSSFLSKEIHAAMINKTALETLLMQNYSLSSKHDLIKHGLEKMNFSFEILNPDDGMLFQSSIEISDDFFVNTYIDDNVTNATYSLESDSKSKVNEIFNTSPIFSSKIEDENLFAFYLEKLINDLCLLYVKDRVPELEQEIYYLPAARSGIMQTTTFVNQSAIENAISLSNGSFNGQRMTGVIADFINTIDHIRQATGSTDLAGAKNDLGNQIESRILRGKVDVIGEGALSQIRYAPNGWNNTLPMSRVSSMISEITPIVLYFRHLLKAGDTLILEEPEAHVHPEAQLTLVKEISYAISKGVNIILTTHSEWITEEIRSLIDLSNYPESERHLDGREITALKEEDVGLWLFEEHDKDKGSVFVKKIECGEDSQDLGFANAYSSVTNDVALIHNRIQNESKTMPEDQ